MSSGRYIDTAEASRMIRSAVKAKFPSVKFSVRLSRYAGGSSITVSWTDGPTEKQVKGLVGAFSGAHFDGMIDLQTYVDSWLSADGSVSYEQIPGAERVHFGCNYVQTHREFSHEFVQRAAKAYNETYGELIRLDLRGGRTEIHAENEDYFRLQREMRDLSCLPEEKEGSEHA